MIGKTVSAQINLANVVPDVPAVGSNEKGLVDTFVGLIHASSDLLRSYVKLLNPRKFANDLIRANFGYAVGLQLPEELLGRAI